MKTAISLIFSGILCLLPGISHAINADDFLPPAQADPAQAAALEQVVQPEAIKTEAGASGQEAIAANNAQDAINASAQAMKSDQKWEEVGGGCREIKFPSGFGFVASGQATYGVTPNPTANLLAQRKAYQIAYLNAKKNLAGYLNEMSTSGKEQLLNEYKGLITGNDTLSNLSESHVENIQELIRGLLKGYVVYSLDDRQDGDTGIVTVTIVSTPKTMAGNSRVMPNAVSTESVRSGLNAVLAELSGGLLPPVGGKVISVPGTGELAFAGFGSAVVPDNPDKAVRLKLALEAQKIAQMRARSALCGILLGDEIEAASTLDQSTKSMSRQFDELQKEDPLTGAQDKAEITKLQDQVKSFVSSTLSTEAVSSLRKGVLPPGINIRTFMNPEKTLAQAIAVYVPGVSANAAKFGSEMRDAKPLEGAAAGAGARPPQGPSGQISNDADL